MDDLDDLLNKRHCPEAPGNLAYRIMQAAREHRPACAHMSILEELCAVFILPRPVMALAASILFGLIIGLQASGVLNAEYHDWSSFLIVDEGDWL